MKNRKRKILTDFGRNPMEIGAYERGEHRLDEIKLYYEETKDELPEGSIDEITWNDLEMDRIFFRINHTGSFIGEQVLYRRLHILETEESKKKTELAVETIQKDEKIRSELMQALSNIGKNTEDYSLPLFLLNAGVLVVEHLWIYRVLQILLAGSFLLAALTQQALFIALCAGTALLNLVVYAVGKVKYEAYLHALGSVKELVVFAGRMMKRKEYRELFYDPGIEEAVKRLSKLTRLIGSFQMKKSAAWTGDVMDLFRDYLIGMTLWDITVFGKMTRLISGKLTDLLLVYEFIGGIDLAISIASFQKSLPFSCQPEFKEDAQIEMEKVYHPLLMHPISNDWSLKGGCLITGANASGKSTFMKAVAINVILAQSIHTCMAERFVLPHLRVCTSMAVRDDIMSKESYYVREANYLKNIVTSADTGELSLYLIDEIFRGTNTKERLAASEAVLRYLAGKNCMVIVATHDMELVDALKQEYVCFHFETQIKEKDILFDYKIRKGPGNSKNAIKLLEYLGFPKVITKMAEDLCR